MKLLRSERGMVLALVVIGATIAVARGTIDGAAYVAVLTLCVQAVLAYKAMPAQVQSKP